MLPFINILYVNTNGMPWLSCNSGHCCELGQQSLSSKSHPLVIVHTLSLWFCIGMSLLWTSQLLITMEGVISLFLQTIIANDNKKNNAFNFLQIVIFNDSGRCNIFIFFCKPWFFTTIRNVISHFVITSNLYERMDGIPSTCLWYIFLFMLSFHKIYKKMIPIYEKWIILR